MWAISWFLLVVSMIKSHDRINVREKGFILAPSERVWSIMAEELEKEGPDAAVHRISSQEAARNEMCAATLLPSSICTVQDLSQEMASPTLGRFSQVSQDAVGGSFQLS